MGRILMEGEVDQYVIFPSIQHVVSHGENGQPSG